MSQEHLQTREEFRKKMYVDMYGRQYRYYRVVKNSGAGGSYSGGISGGNSFDESLDDSFDDLTPVDPLKPPTKGYVPPTDFDPNRANPFGGVLDAPLG